MFSIGLAEILIILMVAIVFIKPKSLPGFLRTLGRFYGILKRYQQNFQWNLEKMEYMHSNTEDNGEEKSAKPEEDESENIKNNK